MGGGGGGEARRGMRLSIFTSSLNYENFVSAQNLSFEVRAPSASRTAMVLGKYREVFLPVPLRDCQRGSGVCLIYERQFAITRCCGKV